MRSKWSSVDSEAERSNREAGLGLACTGIEYACGGAMAIVFSRVSWFWKWGGRREQKVQISKSKIQEKIEFQPLNQAICFMLKTIYLT
jgi:hypothetical protein